MDKKTRKKLPTGADYKVIKSESVTTIDANGNQETTTKETALTRTGEPDYIKLYTKVWCEFNEIPLKWRSLFLELAMRMSYCNSQELDESQLVCTGKPFSSTIMKALGWTSESTYKKGLKALCDCNAIRKVARGVYQINPSYAARGNWRYNPQLSRGGVIDLVAEFNFVQGTCKTKIVWADDGNDDDELNKIYRDGLGVKKGDEDTVLKHTQIAVNE